MVAPSKLFTYPLNCYHCSQVILHPGIGCFQYFLRNLLFHGVSGLKYFLPLLITPFILKYKSIDRDLFTHTIKHYLQTVLWGCLATTSLFFWICCLRNMLGNFHTYTTIFVPTVLGFQFCWFFPPRVLKLFTTATSQTVLEGLLLQYSNRFTRLILDSSKVQTILFMLNSALILHYKRKNIYKDFWFIQPHEKLMETKLKVRDQESLVSTQRNGSEKFYTKSKRKCHHTNCKSCWKFLLDGMKSYIFYGIPWDVMAMVMGGKLKQIHQGFMQKVLSKIKTFRPSMTCFFLTYVGIYRLSSCLLRKYDQFSLDIQHGLAAFLGGLSFIFVKRINFVTLSLIISTQLLWQEFCNSMERTKSDRKGNLILMMLTNAPISQMILPFTCGYVVHNYIVNNHLINNLAGGFVNGLTHGKGTTIRNTFLSNDMRTLIEMAQSYPIKTFL